MSVARSTGSPTLRRTPGSTTAQMDENTKVGGDNFSVSSPGDQLKSLLNFVSLILVDCYNSQSHYTYYGCLRQITRRLGHSVLILREISRAIHKS
ncbi:hypothetical protein F5Y08DRAFT_306510 [Xylaria arbuscula]|nr:hypothetical protein F5Y08DRAFT_306510 [Xylaria arbuscula]